MEYNFDTITPCGGDCSDCEHFLGKECLGCLTNEGSRAKLWGSECLIFACCKKHKVRFCGLCGEFPCKESDRIQEWDKDNMNKQRHMAEAYGKRCETTNVYKCCPKFENSDFLIRRTQMSDKEDLLKVYSDPKAVPFFNSDNCHGDDFYYTTIKRMEEALLFWEQSYRGGWFVRFSVIEKKEGKAVGTVELFRRGSDNAEDDVGNGDTYNGCGILRLDLRSDYEKEEVVLNILSLIILPSYKLFGCKTIATKAIKKAEERIRALKKYGFRESSSKLKGEDGKEYSDYFSVTEG